MSTEPRARRRTAFSEPLRNERPINKRKVSTTCIACEPPVVSARASVPARRHCRACEQNKTAASFAGPTADRCRKCVRDHVEIAIPKPVSKKRRCVACKVERGPACFEKSDRYTALCCTLCTSNPDAHITLQELDAAAVVLRALRQIRAARLDEASTCPALGVEALRQLAADALAVVEEAR